MKSFRDRNPYAIGIGSMLLIGVFVGAAFMVGVLHLLEHDYSVRAVFGDAAGIRSGADVRVAGIKAGRVSSVKADRDNGRILITLLVHKGVHLGPTTHAEIALETLLGTKYVRLSGDVPRQGPYLEDQRDKSGACGPDWQKACVPFDRTKTPFDIFELTKIGTRSIEATDTAKLNDLIKDLATITAGKHDQVHELLDGLARVSAAVNDRDAQLRDLLDRFDKLSGLLADKDQTLVGLIDESQGVLDLVQRRRDDIASAIDSGDVAFQNLSGVLASSKTELGSILATLHPAIDVVDRHQQAIDRALSWVGDGSLGLAKATTHGPWEDVYVRSLGPDLVQVLHDSLHPGGAP